MILLFYELRTEFIPFHPSCFIFGNFLIQFVLKTTFRHCRYSSLQRLLFKKDDGGRRTANAFGVATNLVVVVGVFVDPCL